MSLAAVLHGPRDLRVEPRDPGPLAPGMVRVAFGAGGICGSDLAYYRRARTGDYVVTSPLVLGHEVAGTVAAVGEGVSGLAPGTRVAVNPSRWCGACPRCREGRANLCESIYFMGSASKTPHMQGGFAALFDATPAQCEPVPDGVPMAAAALAEPLAVALHAARRGGPLGGRTALVVGAGPIGLLTLLVLKHHGAGAVTVADLAAAPLALAARLGADAALDLTGGEAALAGAGPFDLAYEVSGTAAGLATAIRAVRRGGVVVQVGNLPGGEVPVPANAIMAKELDLRGSFRFGAEFAEAVALIAAGAIDVLALVTAERPLPAAREAFEEALDRGRSVKVMLTG